MNPFRMLVLCAALALPTQGAAQDSKPIRLASPGFTGVNVDEKVATFFSEHFAQKLSLQGISVMSPSEVSALVGLERQKQLMGCGEDSSSCLAELANALGADGVITGSIGKFGNTFQVNIKVLSAANASALSIISKKAYGEEELLTLLDDAAEVAAEDLRTKLGRTGEGVVRREPETVEAPAESNTVTPAPPPTQRRMNNLTFWALGPISGVYALEYERAVWTHLSLFLQPAVIAYLGEVGVELGGGARLYLGGLAPQGFFVGAELKGGVNSLWGGSFAVAGGLGYTFRIADFITLSVGGGGGTYLAGGNPVDNSADPWLDFHLRGHLGVAF